MISPTTRREPDKDVDVVIPRPNAAPEVVVGAASRSLPRRTSAQPAARSKLYDLFQCVRVLNLSSRPDRWTEFQSKLPADWPFRQPERMDAINGRLVPPPAWWRSGPGAWGCYRSHLSILEDCLNRNIDSVLLIEDDARFVPDFRRKTEEFFAHLPNDWSFVYLGGEHLKQRVRLPRKINDFVYRPFNVNRTHCFALRGRQTIETVYRHLNAFSNWTADHHIDHHLGDLHMRMDHGLYTPREWLAQQAEGRSNVNDKEWGPLDFVGAESLTTAKIDLPMVAVLGQYRGGTSCLAGVLHQLGVNMGAEFPKPNKANPKGFFEATRLADLCRMFHLEPWLTEGVPSEDRIALLRRWAGDRCLDLRGKSRLAGGKHPILCLLGADLMQAWNDPKFIVVDRPVDESIRSAIKANWGWPEPAIRYGLNLLVEAREEFLEKYAPRHLRVSFHRTLLHPARVVDEICEFLELSPEAKAREQAIAFVTSQKGG